MNTPEKADNEQNLLASREAAKDWYDFELRQLSLLILAHAIAVAVVLFVAHDLHGLGKFGLAFCVGIVLAIVAYIVTYYERRKLVVRYYDLDSSVIDELAHYTSTVSSLSSVAILCLTILALGVFMWSL